MIPIAAPVAAFSGKRVPVRGLTRSAEPASVMCHAAGTLSPAIAGDGGGSHHSPGTWRDVRMGVFCPPGHDLHSDLWFHDTVIGIHPRDGTTAAGGRQDVWLTTLKHSCLSDKTLFGARYGASMAATYVIDGAITGDGDRSGAQFAVSGNVSGVSGLDVAPGLLNWASETRHFTVQLDWTIAQPVSKRFAAGVSGSWLTQIESDVGDLAGLQDGSDITAWSWGIGPSFQWTVSDGDTSLGVVAKGLFDIDAQDCLTGNMFMLSVSHAI